MFIKLHFVFVGKTSFRFLIARFSFCRAYLGRL